MEMFIGTKIVKALAMDRAEYNTYRGWDLPADEDGSDEGYLVEYLDGGKSNHPYHDGYISWSPKEQFDNAYSKTSNPREQEIEKKIQNKGLNAPRLTPELIDSVIAKAEYHLFESTLMTVCCLTLVNEFNVIGESACVSAENFDAEIGREVAFNKARNKIWELEGYLLKQRVLGPIR